MNSNTLIPSNRITSRNQFHFCGLYDLFFGVQIGLETHRRKNIGGEFFSKEVEGLLKKIAANLSKLGRRINVGKEETISYGTGLSKRVDFTLKENDKVLFGVEVNFYTVTGSKPSDIKRSYGEVLRGLQGLGIGFIWVTDGKGYRKMKKSLQTAFNIIHNIYNLKQAEKFLESDIATLWNFKGDD